MITNYSDFVLNEGYTNPQKVYTIDKIKLRTQGEYLANPSLIDEDIAKFRNLSELINLDDILRKKDYSKYSSALKEFIKTKAYNKLVEVMYGKGYNNPEKDSTEIIVGLDPSSMASAMKYGSTPKTIKMTRGEYFKKVWARVDEYCDNSVEFLQKGIIEDTLGDFVDYSKNILLIILASVIIYFGAKAMAVGASGVVTFASSTTGLSAIRNIILNAGVKSMPFVEKCSLAIQRLVSNPKTWMSLASWEIFDAAPKIIEMFSSNDADVLLQLDEEHILEKLSEKNKKVQIAKIKKALEEHSDFNVKPFLDGPVQVWQDAFQRMPGWEAWSQKEGKSINNNPQNLGYIFTYYISLYAYQFQLFIWKYNYLLTLKEGRDVDFSKL